MDKNRERIIQENCDQKSNYQVELYVARKVLSVLSIFFLFLSNKLNKKKWQISSSNMFIFQCLVRPKSPNR